MSSNLKEEVDFKSVMVVPGFKIGHGGLGMKEQITNLKGRMRETMVRRNQRQYKLPRMMEQRQGYQRQRKGKMVQGRH